MTIPLFFAMTWGEMSVCGQLPENLGYMACHFSQVDKGLTDLPGALMPGAMLIVNDRLPPDGHDPSLIARQVSQAVEAFRCSSVLLDFQRPDMPQTAAITKAIVKSCPCPAAVAKSYANDLTCPVFLPPVPPHVPWNEYLVPWRRREVWLDVSPSPTRIRITKDGSEVLPLPSLDQPCHHDQGLDCHYSIQVSQEEICFDLIRTPEDITSLLQKAPGVTCAVGLYQEIGHLCLSPAI